MNIEIAKLLDKLEYRVVVYVTENGCIVEFPERKQAPISSCALMSIQYTQDSIHVQHTNIDGVEIYSAIHKCPPYAQRLLLNYYIMMMCMVIRYSLYYIKFMCDEEEMSEDGFFQMVRSPYMAEDMVNMESILGNILMPCIAHDFNEQHTQLAQEHDVLEGFLAVQQALTGDANEEV